MSASRFLCGLSKARYSANATSITSITSATSSMVLGGNKHKQHVPISRSFGACTRWMTSASSGADSLDQIEEEDRKILPKDQDYYAENAEQRRYFYVLDTRGQIFLEETMPRNIATCMKDVKFLNFMHRTMRPNNTGQHLSTHPYVSFCGKEINYVSPVDKYSSFCFKDLSPYQADGPPPELMYGSNLVHPFAVENLFYQPITGRIYHKIVDHKYLTGHLALLHPFLCQRLATDISWDATKSKYCIKWEGTVYELDTPSGSSD
jgi:hypothetical protein